MRLYKAFFKIIFTLSTLTMYGQVATNLKTDRVMSPSLEGNLLGDTPEREIQIYLPPSYNTSVKRYPVVYYLMGYNGSGRNPYREVETDHFELINSKIVSGRLSEVIVVYVAGSNKLRGSFYYNSPVTGNWGDFITKDVVSHIDTKYRTIASKEARALCGNSMGGYGALNLAMLHPGLFCGVYGISPGLYNDNGFFESQIVKRKGNLANMLNIIDMFGQMPKEQAHTAFMQYLDTLTNKTLFFSLAYGTAHAPNASHAPYFHFPYKVEGNDTVVIKEYWQMWQDGFGGVEKKVMIYKENLKQLKLIGLACGYNEGYNWLLNGCYYFSEKLKENNINHVLYMHNGTHTSHTTDVFINNALPLLTNIMTY